AGYFRTLRIPLLAGRDFRDTDDQGAPDVGIINRAFAERLWPGEDPLGKEIRLFGDSPFTVVGIFGDIRQTSLDREPLPEMYVPVGQFPVASTVYFVRSAPGVEPSSLMPSLRAAVWEIDDDVPIPLLRPLPEIVGESVATERLVATLLSGFAALALVLGIIGVYGVMAYVAGGRRREFAVRTALGASRRDVERAALLDGLPPLAIGLTLGLGGALAAGRLLGSMLHDVAPTDPLTLAAVMGFLAATTLLASWVPARRAGRAEAATALRE
ncbi:MAG: ABC transporter permease, partial [Gemmatimonadota bacterium]